MTTIARSSITGRFVSWLFARKNPDTTTVETIKRPMFDHVELVYIQSTLEALDGTKRNQTLRKGILAKIAEELG